MGTASNATPLDDQEEKVMCSEVFQTKEGVTSMQDFPCKNCQKRHTGCHGTCSEYLLAQTENARNCKFNGVKRGCKLDYVDDYVNEETFLEAVKLLMDVVDSGDARIIKLTTNDAVGILRKGIEILNGKEDDEARRRI